jgi:hypothetical protein
LAKVLWSNDFTNWSKANSIRSKTISIGSRVISNGSETNAEGSRADSIGSGANSTWSEASAIESRIAAGGGGDAHDGIRVAGVLISMPVFAGLMIVLIASIMDEGRKIQEKQQLPV